MKPPAYRNELSTGVVHFGPGAFHRAHQADYFDRLAYQDPLWGIAGVSLRSTGTIDALKRQSGLYNLVILDAESSIRTIGVHNRLLGPSDSDATRAQLLDPAVKLVTSTVTEKGYCLAGDGTLDFDHPHIAHDVEHPSKPVSLVGWLALGLRDRRAASLAPFTPVCCDNMAVNGAKLRQAVSAYAGRFDPELARWIDGEVRFPATVVDSITPATDDALRQLVLERSGCRDEVPVAREAFCQWVIEDVIPAGGPDLRSVGATYAADVTAWERAKLRILNGAHSTLAYVGQLAGYETVADAMGDSRIEAFIRRVVFSDIIPTLQPSPIDLRQYAEDTFGRFRNPVIGHRLAQIAWDGSQKLPYRLLDTIRDARSMGRPIDRLAIPIAAWILFIERQSKVGAEIVDPLAGALVAAARATDAVGEFLRIRQVFAEDFESDEQFRGAITRAVADMRSHGVAATIEACLTTDAEP